ncbi:MAG: hypothetical protein ABIH00_05920 [Armatimonadota bacterium]
MPSSILILNDKNPAPRYVFTNSPGVIINNSFSGKTYFLSEDGHIYSIDLKNERFPSTYMLNFNPASGVFTSPATLYISNKNEPFIYHYSMLKRKVIDRLKFKNSQSYFATDQNNKKVVSYEEKDKSLNIVNVRYNEFIKNIPLNKDIIKMLPSGYSQKLYILTPGSGFIIFNIDSMAVEKKFNIGTNIVDFDTGKGRQSGDLIFAIDKSENKLYILKSNKIIKEHILGKQNPSLISLSPEGYCVYIYYGGTNEVEKINLKNSRVLKTYKLNPIKPSQLMVLPADEN